MDKPPELSCCCPGLPIRLVAASRGNLMTLWGEGASPETVKSLSPSGSPGHSNGAANGAANGVGSPASSNVDLEAGEGRAVRGGSKLPFQPMCLTFSDVKYSVPYPKVSLLARRCMPWLAAALPPLPSCARYSISCLPSLVLTHSTSPTLACRCIFRAWSACLVRRRAPTPASCCSSRELAAPSARACSLPSWVPRAPAR